MSQRASIVGPVLLGVLLCGVACVILATKSSSTTELRADPDLVCREGPASLVIPVQSWQPRVRRPQGQLRREGSHVVGTFEEVQPERLTVSTIVLRGILAQNSVVANRSGIGAPSLTVHVGLDGYLITMTPSAPPEETRTVEPVRIGDPVVPDLRVFGAYFPPEGTQSRWLFRKTHRVELRITRTNVTIECPKVAESACKFLSREYIADGRIEICHE